MSSRTGKALHAYDDLHGYSIEDPAAFWSSLRDFTKVSGDKGGAPFSRDAGRMPGAQFLPNARLAFAESPLRHSGSGDAILFRGEDKVKRRLSARRGGQVCCNGQAIDGEDCTPAIS